MVPVIVWSRIARSCGGLWSFLTARACGRARVDLERERNRGTEQVIRLLPPGAELVEGDAHGWRRAIRMPDIRPAPTAGDLPE
jgi:hypothetical protein